MKTFGVQSMALPLRTVLMHAPGEALRHADPKEWHYGPSFDPEKAIVQYERFQELVVASGPEIVWLGDALDASGEGLADAIFTQDPSMVTNAGAVLLSMGKPQRRAEVNAHEAAYRKANIPIIGRLSSPGTVEGGDCIWLNETTLVIGRGVRTNEAGITQLAALLAPHGITVLGYDLPLWQGEAACLHLMSVISPLDADLFLVFAPLLPAPLYQRMKAEGIDLIDAPADEFHASNGLSLNVLPTAPRDVIMIDGFPKTKAAMESAGCRVSTFEGDALCIACEGGPTCLTQPILRDGG